MEMERLAEIFEAVKVLPLRPTDKVVIKINQAISSEQRNQIVPILEREFSGHRVIVLDAGMDLEVLRQEA